VCLSLISDAHLSTNLIKKYLHLKASKKVTHCPENSYNEDANHEFQFESLFIPELFKLAEDCSNLTSFVLWIYLQILGPILAEKAGHSCYKVFVPLQLRRYLPNPSVPMYFPFSAVRKSLVFRCLQLHYMYPTFCPFKISVRRCRWEGPKVKGMSTSHTSGESPRWNTRRDGFSSI